MWHAAGSQDSQQLIKVPKLWNTQGCETANIEPVAI